MFRQVLVCATLLASTTSAVLGQHPLKIDGITEPPELTGEPKTFSQATQADRDIMDIVGHLKDETTARTALPSLDKLILDNPKYSDAYFLRAYVNACVLNQKNFESITADIESAKRLEGEIYKDGDYQSLLAKIAFAKSDMEGAVGHLEAAMKYDLDAADRIFNIEGTEPASTSKFCVWNLSDLNTLTGTFPKDYRVWLFKGLYYQFFATFDESYYSPAAQDFRNAAARNQRSPLPDYFIGSLYGKASFWTKKAWSSEEGRNEPIRSAVQAYSRAIQIDPQFYRAYAMRAGSYLALKQYQAAIKDFDVVLKANPKNDSAYSDRGIAKLESGQYYGAISDFDDAIRLKNQNDSFIGNLYEYSGDAEAKLHNYTKAIQEYSRAIERQLSNLTFLISLKQFRAIYPEYDGVPDEILLHKLNDLFWPQFEYKVFVEQLNKNGKWGITSLNELYEKRGDSYLKSGDFPRAVLDFNRIYKGIPDFANSTERWRLLGTSIDGGEYYMDVKSADFSSAGLSHFWIKNVEKRKTQAIAYDVDCKNKRLSTTAEATYDAAGKLISSSDLGGSWQPAVPDTIGERLLNGTCSSRL